MVSEAVSPERNRLVTEDEMEPITVTLGRCEGFDVIRFKLSDGRQTSTSTRHSIEKDGGDTYVYHCDEWTFFHATREDVVKMMADLQEIADKYYPVVPAVTEEV